VSSKEVRTTFLRLLEGRQDEGEMETIIVDLVMKRGTRENKGVGVKEKKAVRFQYNL
jgi:hypothetical protein